MPKAPFFHYHLTFHSKNSKLLSFGYKLKISLTNKKVIKWLNKMFLKK